MVSNVKQALIVGGVSLLILWIAYEVNKRYPLVKAKETEPTSTDGDDGGGAADRITFV